MKKMLILIFCIRTIEANVLRFAYEKYKEYPYTSKVIGGSCSILAGTALAAVRASSLKNKPSQALLPAGLILTGAVLLKLARNELTQLATGYYGPYCYCKGCDKNPKAKNLFIPGSGICYCKDCDKYFRGSETCLHCNR